MASEWNHLWNDSNCFRVEPFKREDLRAYNVNSPLFLSQDGYLSGTICGMISTVWEWNHLLNVQEKGSASIHCEFFASFICSDICNLISMEAFD